MIIETLRLVAGLLNDPTAGVNARLAAKALIGSDTRPPTVTIYEETTSVWVAKLEIPQDVAVTTPVLTVQLASEVTVEGIGENYGAGERVVGAEVPVGLMYFRRLGDTEVASDGAYMTLEAAHQALRSLHFNQTGTLVKDLGDVRLKHLVSWTIAPARDTPGDLPVVALATAVIAVSVTLPVT